MLLIINKSVNFSCRIRILHIPAPMTFKTFKFLEKNSADKVQFDKKVGDNPI